MGSNRCQWLVGWWLQIANLFITDIAKLTNPCQIMIDLFC